MSETYPRKNLCETLFAGHTPSRVGIGCKGTTKNAHTQVMRVFFYKKIRAVKKTSVMH